MVDLFTPDDAQFVDLQNVKLLMIFLGIGEILGAFFIGTIVDKIGSKFAALVNSILIIVSITLTYLLIKKEDKDFIGFLVCFFWGLQDASINTHSQEIISFEFFDVNIGFAIYQIF